MSQRQSKSQRRGRPDYRNQKRKKELRKKEFIEDIELKKRLESIRSRGWIQHPYKCRETIRETDIGQLYSTSTRGMHHFRGLYIHGHLDDPPVGYTFYKNLELPKWWFIMSKQNKEVNV